MQNLAPDFLPAFVALVSLLIAMLLVGPARHAFYNMIAIYLVIGVIIAGMQYWSGGECPDWRRGGFWQSIVNWPGGFYANVWEREMPFRTYLMPRVCDEGKLSPADVDALKNFGKK